jgi:uncharacterized membrane protein
MIGIWAAVFSWLSILRYRAFWTGRFDLGNMVQAVWSTAHGRPLESTDAAGEQIVRLGGHVDPILGALAPLWWVWPSPVMLLVVQVVATALGALPVLWLGRKWLADDRLALAGAAVYLLYPPLQWQTVSEFHPVALATPLLLFAIWAIEERRPVVLALSATLAVLSKEQVGLAVAMLGVWVLVRHRRRLWAGLMIVGGGGWAALSVLVIIPHFAPTGASPFVDRYSSFGGDGGSVVRTLLTEPWRAADALASADKLGYLAALLLPVLVAPLAAPLLLLGAGPDLLLNTLTDYWPQYAIENQYAAVIIPFVIAAMIAGLARIRRRATSRVGRAVVGRPTVVSAVMIGTVLVSGYHLGPLPIWDDLPGGSDYRTYEFTVAPHTRAMAAAVDLVPDDVPVSAGNLLGARLSARKRIYSFPVIADAQWVLVDTTRPFLVDRLALGTPHAAEVRRMNADRRFEVVYDTDGVIVWRRTA